MKMDQVDKQGQLKHLLQIKGLTPNLLNELLNQGEKFISLPGSPIEKSSILNNKTIVNLFFENSTRTLGSFTLAAQRLGADVFTLNLNASSIKKGESLLDTVRTIEAMNISTLIVRHRESGSVEFIAEHLQSGISVINAGDGNHAHPTQALLDMLTIRQHKPNFKTLSVAIVGDILHSRVARSEIFALKLLGVPDIRIIGPDTLVPTDNLYGFDIPVHQSMEEGLKDADVIITLRLQKERMEQAQIPDTKEYHDAFGLTAQRLKLAKPDAIVMHPGPMNRGVEIDSDVADGPQSVILQQVNCGIAARMAVLSMLNA